jgi:hypothetical protein
MAKAARPWWPQPSRPLQEHQKSEWVKSSLGRGSRKWQPFYIRYRLTGFGFASTFYLINLLAPEWFFDYLTTPPPSLWQWYSVSLCAIASYISWPCNWIWAIQAYAEQHGYLVFKRDTRPNKLVYACDRAGKYDPKGKNSAVHASKQRKNTGFVGITVVCNVSVRSSCIDCL